MSATTFAIAAAAILAVAGGLTALLLRLRALLAQEETTPDADRPPRRHVLVRPAGAALAAVAVLAVVIAVSAGRDDAAAHSAEAPGTAGAVQTLREFLATAVLDDAAYPACEYLTPHEQQRVAQLAGPGATCRDALTSVPPALPGVGWIGRVRDLPLRTVVDGGRVRITLTDARGPVTFVLRPATGAERNAFGAPPAAWRIASGAGALLRSSTSQATR